MPPIGQPLPDQEIIYILSSDPPDTPKLGPLRQWEKRREEILRELGEWDEEE